MSAANDSIDLVDRLVAEYADRLARDEDPRREELLAQAPQFHAELERCFRMLEAGTDGPGELAGESELGDYRLGRVLGRGGMAVVYEAEQKSLRRRVALKVLRAHLTLEAKQLERFQREARAAAKLAHEHSVPIHAVGTERGHAFIAFELVDGPTLARVIDALAARKSRPSAADLARESGNAALASSASYAAACVELLRGVFAAVEHAHANGVIHRDLKPSNVLLTHAGKALVADFGLAKDAGEASLSLTGETLGTPHYMSPEQANALANLVDGRTDVYSLGVTLYELLTLRRPFEGDTLRELVAHIATTTPRAPSELAPDVPERLGDVVLKALAKEREQRYASVAEFAADLERALRGEDTRAPSARGVLALIGGLFEARLKGRPFEYRSRATLFGLPWIHVVHGVRDPRTHGFKWAKGVIAAGECALGFSATGTIAIGVFSLGLLSLGCVSIGALALGLSAFAFVAFGWNARGGFVTGMNGRGLIDEWLWAKDTESVMLATQGARRDPPLNYLFALIGVALSLTVAQAIWLRLARHDDQRRFVRLVTRLWMPLAFLFPLGFELWGAKLPFAVYLIGLGLITGLFGLLVRRKLGLGLPA